jgi:hypothetical protein
MPGYERNRPWKSAKKRIAAKADKQQHNRPAAIRENAARCGRQVHGTPNLRRRYDDHLSRARSKGTSVTPDRPKGNNREDVASTDNSENAFTPTVPSSVSLRREDDHLPAGKEKAPSKIVKLAKSARL